MHENSFSCRGHAKPYRVALSTPAAWLAIDLFGRFLPARYPAVFKCSLPRADQTRCTSPPGLPDKTVGPLLCYHWTPLAKDRSPASPQWPHRFRPPLRSPLALFPSAADNFSCKIPPQAGKTLARPPRAAGTHYQGTFSALGTASTPKKKAAAASRRIRSHFAQKPRTRPGLTRACRLPPSLQKQVREPIP